MSYILDALRKSEDERRREAGATVSRTPYGAARAGVPVWASATIGVLSVGIAVLGIAWWQATGDNIARPEAGAAAPERIEPVSLPPAPSLMPQSAAAEPATAPGRPESSSRGTGAARSLRDVAAITVAAPAGGMTSAGGTPGTSASAEPRSPSAPRIDPRAARLDSAAPSYRAAAPGLGLPPLSLNLLAYGDTPAERFAFIGGQRYQEGDVLFDGVELFAITPDHAVIVADGQQLRLFAY